MSQQLKPCVRCGSSTFNDYLCDRCEADDHLKNSQGPSATQLTCLSCGVSLNKPGLCNACWKAQNSTDTDWSVTWKWILGVAACLALVGFGVKKLNEAAVGFHDHLNQKLAAGFDHRNGSGVYAAAQEKARKNKTRQEQEEETRFLERQQNTKPPEDTTTSALPLGSGIEPSKPLQGPDESLCLSLQQQINDLKRREPSEDDVRISKWKRLGPGNPVNLPGDPTNPIEAERNRIELEIASLESDLANNGCQL